MSNDESESGSSEWETESTTSEFEDNDIHNHLLLHLLDEEIEVMEAALDENSSDVDYSDLHLMCHVLQGGVGAASEDESEVEEAVVYKHLVLNMLSGDLGSTRNETVEEMDPGLWSQLPEDILERVLQKLPIVSNFRFRTVCRSWLALMSSSSFLKQCVPTAPQISAYQLVSNKEEVVDSLGLSVYKLDLSFVPTSISSAGAADKGLICCCTFPRKHNKVALYVCNPILRVWKALPEFSLQDEQYWESSLVVNSGLDSFQVIVVCETDEDCIYWTVNVYSSEADSWKTFLGDPSRAPCFGGSYMVTSEGVLYYVDTDDQQVVVYDLLDGKLARKCEVMLPLYLHTQSALLEYKEDVLLVGDLWNGGAYFMFGIWKLDKREGVWEEVAKTSAELGEPWDDDHCKAQLGGGVAIGDLICLDVEVHYRCNYYKSSNVGWKYALAFDMVSKSWKVFHMNSLRDGGPSLFQPRLDSFP